MTAPRRFFFYGTLLKGMKNPSAKAVHARLCDLGAARVRGQLIAIPDPDGWYPALIGGEGWVKGRLYAALPQFSRADLTALDAYEGYRPDHAWRSEYRRALVAVRSQVRRTWIGAQAYRYCTRIPSDALVIAGGDFIAWLEATGAEAFRTVGPIARQ